MAHVAHPAAALLCAGLLLSCKGKEDDDDDGGGTAACRQTLGIDAGAATSTGSVARHTFDVPTGTRSLLVNARGDASYLYVTELVDPSGTTVLSAQDWWTGGEYYTSGVLPLHEEAVLNWPIREEDGELEPGGWTVALQALSSSGAEANGVEADVVVFFNADRSTADGCATVRVVLTPGVAGDSALTAAVDQALLAWQDVYSGVGLELQPSIETGEGLGEVLERPSTGSAAYESLREGGDEEDLIVVIGETVSNSGSILGETGGIPGPLAPARRGVVVVSWLLHAGTDGVVDQTDAQGMGETMAHEIGHYLGLFHPVELDGSGNYSGYGDALADTPTCGSYSDCLNSLGTNLMFPYRTCDNAGCERQDDITADQAAVLQRYAGTR